MLNFFTSAVKNSWTSSGAPRWGSAHLPVLFCSRLNKLLLTCTKTQNILTPQNLLLVIILFYNRVCKLWTVFPVFNDLDSLSVMDFICFNLNLNICFKPSVSVLNLNSFEIISHVMWWKLWLLQQGLRRFSVPDYFRFGFCASFLQTALQPGDI